MAEEKDKIICYVEADVVGPTALADGYFTIPIAITKDKIKFRKHPEIGGKTDVSIVLSGSMANNYNQLELAEYEIQLSKYKSQIIGIEEIRNYNKDGSVTALPIFNGDRILIKTDVEHKVSSVSLLDENDDIKSIYASGEWVFEVNPNWILGKPDTRAAMIREKNR